MSLHTWARALKFAGLRRRLQPASPTPAAPVSKRTSAAAPIEPAPTFTPTVALVGHLRFAAPMPPAARVGPQRPPATVRRFDPSHFADRPLRRNVEPDAGTSAFPPVFSVVHVETTGRSPGYDHIVRIGALRVFGHEDRRVALSTSTLELEVAPRQGNGRYDRIGISPDRAIRALLDFIGDAPVVLRNAALDGPLVHVAARRAGRSFDNRLLCALDLVRMAWPERDAWEMLKVLSRATRPTDDRPTSTARGTLGAYVAAVNQLQSLPSRNWP